MTTKVSGWTLLSIDYTDIHLSNYEQQGGHSFNPLPKWIKNRGGLINPKNGNKNCFKYAWTIAANLDYLKCKNNDPGRITKKLEDMTYEFDWSGVEEKVGESGFGEILQW